MPHAGNKGLHHSDFSLALRKFVIDGFVFAGKMKLVRFSYHLSWSFTNSLQLHKNYYYGCSLFELTFTVLVLDTIQSQNN